MPESSRRFAPELWDVICQNVKNERDLFSLVVTCKSSSPFALDALWRDLPALWPLVNLFPTDLIKERKESEGDISPSFVTVLARSIQPSDWDRVLVYAARVMALIIIPEIDFFCRRRIDGPSSRLIPTYMRVSPDTYHAMIRSCPVPSIFTRLRQVEAQWSTKLSLSMLQFSVPPDLKTVSLYVSGEVSEEFTSLPAGLSILSTVGTSCPQVESLTFQAPLSSFYEESDMRAQLLDTFSSMVCKWMNLRSVVMPYASDDSFLHLSSLPALAHLVLKDAFAEHLILPETSLPKILFRALREVELECHHLPFVIDLFNYLSSARLESVIVTVRHNFPLPSTWLDFINLLCTVSDPQTLRVLKLVEEGDDDEDLYEDVDLRSLGPKFFVALHSFLNLLELRIESMVEPDISEADVKALAYALPHLTNLVINQTWTYLCGTPCPPPRLSMAILPLLATACPALTEISLFLNTRGALGTIQGLQDVPNVVKSLSVGRSPLRASDVDAVDEFLAKVFPNLTSVECTFKDADMDEDELISEYNESWDDTVGIRLYLLVP
ncbi:hypothetical protein FISHEDRAFT_57938 [Fistulina hepatica ATCC 64428]|uniref:F-box domain-containing protein n=1 Tax=Fistulina hepatica ATCC 64428 TaxID=1128425 RepID=A0A0D7AFP7_9AGAR|nr:hypothetical protein FISHEDRAFT_57938 [Fistulina hepatica ATCC 64428]